jgi:signal transduction histidine kinase/response regulator RpfG family c-di-GMP phosphodiesterase
MDDSKVSILIVDDRPDKLLSLEAVLEDLGQKIVRAYSGREALRYVLQEEFAVILLDINMPDMDGFETAQLIRQRPNSAHVPIIFLTAMSDEMYVSRGYSLGAVDYILTPVVPQVLRSKVAVFVDLFRKTQQVQMQSDRLRQRATQLHRLTSASLAINSADAVEKIVQIATETARELIGAHQAVMIATPGHRHHAHAASHASYSGKYAGWQRLTPKIRDSAHAMICTNNRAMRMTQGELDAHAPLLGTEDAPPLRGLLAAPLSGRDGRNMGLVFLSDKFDGEFSEDDQLASVAIENTIYAEERESNRLKDEFLSTLSHELRTPLNAISGWVQLLKMEPLEGELSHGMDVIERNVKAQTRLIEDLLDLSRITTGKLRLSARPIQIKPVVEAAVDALQPIVEEKGINLNREIDGVDIAVFGDPDRLQQVFWNLMSNAAKFTHAGGTITVRLRSEGEQVLLSIADTGDGMEPGFVPHVFDRFRQADSSSARRHGGLGIGLTIVRHIVELHRGTVCADSPGLGRGSTFTVSFPLIIAAETAVHPQPRDGAKPPSLAKLHVLVVDDEPDAREVVSEILQRYGANVATAASAAEALHLFNLQRPDVVVTDLAMPDQDGFALLKELRRLTPDAGGLLPVIALTAYARPEDQSRAFECGFQDHIAKPVDPLDLVTAIHRCAGMPALPRLGVILDGPPDGIRRLHA